MEKIQVLGVMETITGTRSDGNDLSSRVEMMNFVQRYMES